MENNCNIIRDVLPLYAESIASDETRTFVEEHIAGCADCRGVLENMKTPSEPPVKIGAAALKNWKRKLFRKRLATIIFTSAVVLVITVTVFSFLTAPQYLPYTDDVLTITESEYGVGVTCAFSDKVTGYEIHYYLSEDGQASVYHISTWSTVWDMYFTRKALENITIEPLNKVVVYFTKKTLEDITISPINELVIYYSSNDRTESILLYGPESYADVGVELLPRLVLNYYFLAALSLCAVLAALLLIFRKKMAARFWLERLLLLPASYIVSQLCVKGFSASTYSLQRDLAFILLVAIFIYLACLLGISLYRARKNLTGGRFS